MNDIALGCMGGVLHVALGADHLAAIAPLAARARHRPWLAGMLWGVAHSCGTIAPLLLLLFGFPAAAGMRFSTGAEVVSGALLLASGLAQFSAFARARPGASTFGLVHGMAGAASLAPLVVELAARDQLRPAVFLGAFALGSLAAMMAFSASVRRIAAACEALGPRAVHRASLAMGAACVCIGVYWLRHALG